MRTFLVTGASAGIGEAIALGCAKVPSAAVIIVGRNEQRCKAARDRVAAASHNPNISYEVVDLSSYRSVSDFTKKFRESGKALHVLVNNAASCPVNKELSVDGLEMQFATNVMGYFWLTNGLVDVLQKNSPARVVLVGSDYAGGLDLDDLNYEKRKYENNSAYMASKQANRMLNVAFSKHFASKGIIVNCYHPGGIGSKLASDLGFSLSGTPESGAAPGVMLATSPDVANVTGKWFLRGKETVDIYAKDEAKIDELFERCVQITAKIAGSSR